MGRKYRSMNYFSPNDTNTICDVTGFKVKRGQTLKRWEGYRVIPEAWHPRQPQDFPPVLIEQKTYDDVRFESDVQESIPNFEVI